MRLHFPYLFQMDLLDINQLRADWKEAILGERVSVLGNLIASRKVVIIIVFTIKEKAWLYLAVKSDCRSQSQLHAFPIQSRESSWNGGIKDIFAGINGSVPADRSI